MPKKVVPLSDTVIKNAKAKAKQYTLNDGDGLRVIITPKGKKYFRFDYTRPTGKRNSISIGTYPEITLAIAREKRLQYRKMLASGDDPSIQRRAAESNSESLFCNIADAFYQKIVKGISESTASNYERYLKYMKKAFGEKDINDITIKDISTLLLQFDNEGKQETATRILRLLKTVYKYALSRGLSQHNTAHDIDAKDLLSKKVEKHFDFIDNEKEFAMLLSAIDDYFGDYIVKHALQFASMTFLRPGNVRSLRWNQIDYNNKFIEYSAQEMKAGRKHLVPITPQISELLDNMAKLTKERSKFVFPSPTSNVKMLSENTLNMALKRLGFKGKMTSHGFRHTASTLLHEHMHVHGISSEVVEMQLAHKDENKIRGTYNHAQYLSERRRLMEWWCDYIDEIKVKYGNC